MLSDNYSLSTGSNFLWFRDTGARETNLRVDQAVVPGDANLRAAFYIAIAAYNAAKDVKKNVIKKDLKYENYVVVLFNGKQINHKMKTLNQK